MENRTRRKWEKNQPPLIVEGDIAVDVEEVSNRVTEKVQFFRRDFPGLMEACGEFSLTLG